MYLFYRTYTEEYYYKGEHWAMLDARRCFVIDINGNIKEFERNE